jgi:hypothetical protein
MTSESQGQTVLLLGAGTSVEAGLKDSLDLTKAIADEVDRQHGRYFGTSQALHMAIGAMVAHDTARGGKAFQRIDVERLFSAVQMLAQRDDLEISPFVASWSGALEALGRSRGLPSFFGDNFNKQLGNTGIERVFADGVEALTGRRASIELFSRLEKQMIDALQTVLTVDAADVDYLAPILRAPSRGPIRVATLNYDRSVELMAERAGVDLDTGVEAWQGGYDWAWRRQADVHLLKLHGSLDWYKSQLREEAVMRQDRINVVQGWKARDVVSATLGVVFGQRGKLRSDGPFLAMLGAFEGFLRDADHLVVVGYSFRDDHINASIRRWINHQSAPELTIIDPALSDAASRRTDAGPPFLDELLDAMSIRALPPNVFSAGLHLVAERASVGLERVFGEGPPLATPPAPPETAGALDVR